MILGVGIDLVDSHRIQSLMENHEARFIERYFTAHEAAHFTKIEIQSHKILSLAKRFAAKEACAKALGTGFRDGIYMKDIEVKNDALGKPVIFLTNGALAQLNDMLPDGMQAFLHLSMTDDAPYAQAQVIIEAL